MRFTNKIEKNSKRILLILIFFSIFLTGTALIFTVPISVKETYSLTTRTIDGETIYFNVFEPQEFFYESYNGDTKKPAIIIGHGATLNKEDLKGYAIEIAAAGFVAVPLDFRGLGQSTGDRASGSLLDDIRAIKAYLSTREDIDIHNLGYIGYSMGGIGFQLVKEDKDFKCFIGIGTGLPTDPSDTIRADSGRKLNVLMIQALYDEAISLSRLKEGMAVRLGVKPGDIDVNKLYGSFNAGTASMIYLDDDSNHLKVGWDTDFIRTARNWVINTFPNIRIVDENFYANIRLWILLLQVIGGMGLFFLIIEPVSKKLLKSKEDNIKKIELKDETIKRITLKTIGFSLILGLPGILIFIPILLLLPLATAGFVLTLLFGQWFGIFILLWRCSKKSDFSFSEILKNPFKRSKARFLRELELGAIMAAILYLIIYISIGLNYLGILPSYAKIPFIPLYFVISFFILIIPAIMFHIIIQNMFENTFKTTFYSAAIAFIVQFLYLFTYLFVLCTFINNYYYFGGYVPIALPLFLLTSFVSVVFYQKTGNIISGTIINAFFLTMFLITLSTP